MKPYLTALAVALLGLCGCITTEPEARLQSDEDGDRDKDVHVQTIGDATTVANAEPVAISGVGLVTGLFGTGGGTPPGGFRGMLEDYLRKKRVENIKELLASPDNAMVLVSALIPAGARKGDPIDVEITLPQGSKVSSLRGGYLTECALYNYSSVRQINPNSTHVDRPLIGHQLARAEGPLLVGFGDGDEGARVKQGRIWGGARVEIDRPFWLSLNSDQQYARVSMKVAERINETFQGPYRSPSSTLAEAKTKEVVYLRVAPQYQLNLARYLRVIRFIPLQEAAQAGASYRRKLEEDLLDPSRTITTALRLEALGTDSIAALKKGLQSNHALVRFAAAEALAYLGCPACGEELAKLAAEEPMLRAYCLTALASLDEAVCHLQLRELLSSTSPETRYGAFRALRTLDDRDEFIRGELLNDSFHLHQVAHGSLPLVHISTSRRAEIVVFGDDPYLEPPFSFMAGPEFTVTAGDDDEHCTISRFSLQRGAKRKQCSLKLADVLRTLAELGGGYPDAVELLHQAERTKCLSCQVAVDALPEAPSVVQLAQAGRNGNQKNTDGEILNARAEFGATPNLFQSGTRQAPRHGME
jgi:hypothetical protein